MLHSKAHNARLESFHKAQICEARGCAIQNLPPIYSKNRFLSSVFSLQVASELGGATGIMTAASDVRNFRSVITLIVFVFTS